MVSAQRPTLLWKSQCHRSFYTPMGRLGGKSDVLNKHFAIDVVFGMVFTVRMGTIGRELP